MNEQNQNDGFTSAPSSDGFSTAPSSDGFSSAPAVDNTPVQNNTPAQSGNSGYTPPPATGYTPPPAGGSAPSSNSTPPVDMESAKAVVKGLFTKPLTTIENSSFGFTEAIILLAIQFAAVVLRDVIHSTFTIFLMPLSILGYAVLFAAIIAVVILFGKYVFKSTTFEPKKDWKELFCSAETALFPFTAALLIYLVFYILKIYFFSFLIPVSFFFSMMLAVPVVKKQFGFDNDKAYSAAGTIAAVAYFAYTIII
jgi:hypothetical protein